ncbi:MAG: alpha/beta fold hydrolase [Nocardioides sp.]|uniref:alpha/beta hydrolase family protein n=1 Tax=Nocardioides sp. TaxID=35761 RepID=UPI00326302DD
MSSADATPPEWKAAADAHQRAMPLQRLTGNGMDYADVVALYAAVDTGVAWDEAAEKLGKENVERAEEAAEAGHSISARSWWLAASCCFRVGQVVLEDSARKRDLFNQMMDAYGRAGALSDPPVEHVHVPYQDGTLGGWLALPQRRGLGGESAPVVIIFGGFDGWREEYHVATTYLHQRGVGTLLLDGPGQGESRLFGNLVLDHDFTKAFSTVVDHLVDDPRLGPVGIWGNSMGGYLAAAVAAADDRVVACCVNGGTVRPAEILDRYPRFTAKVQPLLGIPDADEATRALGTYLLGEVELAGLTCPLLVLHGTPDQVFLVENARTLHDLAASTDKTWREWADGDHCIYNHSHEKHTLVADWFADRLTTDTATGGSR